MKRLISVKPETLARLAKLADAVSDLVDYRVEPLQVAALLIERDLEQDSEEELVQAAASAGPRQSAAHPVVRRGGGGGPG